MPQRLTSPLLLNRTIALALFNARGYGFGFLGASDLGAVLVVIADEGIFIVFVALRVFVCFFFLGVQNDIEQVVAAGVVCVIEDHASEWKLQVL